MTTANITKCIGVFALIGIIVSLYALLHNIGFAPGKFCTLGSRFDCDAVNKGIFSNIFGIPIALIGFIGYGFMAVAAFLKLKNQVDKQLTLFLVLASVGGFVFSLYLSGLEAFVLHAWCLICLTSQITIFLILSFVLYLFMKEK